MNDAETFAEDIEAIATQLGEPILSAVISNGRSDYYEDSDYDESDENVTIAIAGKALPWSEVRPLLDYHYDSGYGGQNCHSFYAWTENNVIFLGNYDGSTWVTWVPRNPIDGKPSSVGGG